eukprot:CAMPEP_0197189856 /NCGR_PEP_ID=MMETSP1423-20130617/20521_1 /TAXON_ID=476441 /ORGANISM="Pseudo-nitzschia heimii, Strain UNC1101" /LENGTH=662 /DNA_ID=CAMNT_0042642089 /DNA_START=155 /DNA_END=2140 /DNA_ORIENTATION=-
MNNKQREGEETVDAGAVALTECSSNDFSSKTVYVGDVDELLGASVENKETLAQRSIDVATDVEVNAEDDQSPDIAVYGKHIDGDNKEATNQEELDARHSHGTASDTNSMKSISSQKTTDEDENEDQKPGAKKNIVSENILNQEEIDLKTLTQNNKTMPGFEPRKQERNDSAEISGTLINEESFGLVENGEVGDENNSDYDRTQNDDLSLGSILDDDHNVVAPFPDDSGGNKTDLQSEDSTVKDVTVKVLETSEVPLNAVSIKRKAGMEEESDDDDGASEDISLGSLLDEDCDVAGDYPVEVWNDKCNTEEKKVDVSTDTSKQEICREINFDAAMQVKVDKEDAVHLYPPAQDEDQNDKGDGIDIDELLGDNTNTSFIEKHVDNDDTKRKEEIQSCTNLCEEEKINGDNLERKSSDVGISPAKSNDTEALKLDALLDEPGTYNLSKNDKVEEQKNEDGDNQIPKENQTNAGGGLKSSCELNVSVESADEVALELDALLDDSVSVDFEVIEEPPSQTIQNSTNKPVSGTKTDGIEIISKISNGSRHFQNYREKLSGDRLEGKSKSFMQGKLKMSSSISEKVSSSKKKIASARDRMREYSCQVSNRASKQLRKKGKEINQGDGENKKSILPLSSSSGKRLFVTPVKNVPGDSIREGKEKKLNPLW